MTARGQTELVGFPGRDLHRFDAPLDRQGRAEKTHQLFEAQLQASDDVTRKALLESVVALHLDVASAIAARYRSRGIDSDDLEQVAHLGLLHAAQRFDARAGPQFISFAVPTIRGEIKSYFRDHGWTVRPPRRIQQVQQRLPAARADLERQLGRTPSADEVATYLDVRTKDIAEAAEARGCFTPDSLDELSNPHDGDSTSAYAFLAVDDPESAAVEARVVLRPLLLRLSARDRRVIGLRFFNDCTQSEIAADIGVTQMQVSRLLSRILRDLRDQLLSCDAPPNAAAEISSRGRVGR